MLQIDPIYEHQTFPHSFFLLHYTLLLLPTFHVPHDSPLAAEA